MGTEVVLDRLTDGMGRDLAHIVDVMPEVGKGNGDIGLGPTVVHLKGTCTNQPFPFTGG